jgi:hypothetical protein
MSRYEHETFLDLEREEAKHAAGEGLPDDDGPSRAEQNAELERDRLEDRRRPTRPRRFIRDSNGFAWEAVYPENEVTVRVEER